jgi:hypothetical protein
MEYLLLVKNYGELLMTPGNHISASHLSVDLFLDEDGNTSFHHAFTTEILELICSVSHTLNPKYAPEAVSVTKF